MNIKNTGFTLTMRILDKKKSSSFHFMPGWNYREIKLHRLLILQSLNIWFLSNSCSIILLHIQNIVYNSIVNPKEYLD